MNFFPGGLNYVNKCKDSFLAGFLRILNCLYLTCKNYQQHNRQL